MSRVFPSETGGNFPPVKGAGADDDRAAGLLDAVLGRPPNHWAQEVSRVAAIARD